MMSYKYDIQIFQRYSLKTFDINLPIEAGAPVNPNGMRVN